MKILTIIVPGQEPQLFDLSAGSPHKRLGSILFPFIQNAPYTTERRKAELLLSALYEAPSNHSAVASYKEAYDEEADIEKEVLRLVNKLLPELESFYGEASRQLSAPRS